MIEIPVYDREGQVVETIQFDETCLGEEVNYTLMHQAIVTFEANQRLGTHSVKNRRSVVGRSGKPFKQKGTGRARQGQRRRVGSTGGAVAHGPKPRSYRKDMPKKARRNALRSALLGKLRDGEIVVVSDLRQETPKTRDVARLLKNLKIDKSCLVVTRAPDVTVWKSVRNLAGAEMAPLGELNAYAVLRPARILMTKDALQAMPEELK